MRSYDNKQFGFGVVGVIIVSIVLITLCFAGWRIWDASQNKTAQTNNQTSATDTATTTSQANPNEGYLVIDSWGVRFKPVAGLLGLKAINKPSSLADAEEQMLITEEMQKLGAACGGNTVGSRPLGALVRTRNQITQPGSLQFLAQINGFYYYYYAPASSCSPDATNESIQANTLEKVKSSLKSLEAKK